MPRELFVELLKSSRASSLLQVRFAGFSLGLDQVIGHQVQTAAKHKVQQPITYAIARHPLCRSELARELFVEPLKSSRASSLLQVMFAGFGVGLDQVIGHQVQTAAKHKVQQPITYAIARHPPL